MTALIIGGVLIVISLVFIILIRFISKEIAKKAIESIKYRIMWSPILRG